MAADVLDRVRKLLALAQSPNVHEAAAAAAKAQALIAAHRLEALLAAEAAAEARAEADPIEEQVLERAKRLRRWKAVLAAGLAEVNGCIAYTREVGRASELVLAGRAADRAAVLAMWEGLVRQLTWLSATVGGDQDKRWHDDFRVGAAATVIDRLRACEAEAAAGLSATALEKVQPALALRHRAVTEYADQKLNLKQGRGIRVDPDAYDRGRAAGRAVALDGRAVSGSR